MITLTSTLIRSASQKPHQIVVYYISKNPGRVSHAVRPGLNDAVKFILRIGFARNNGGEL